MGTMCECPWSVRLSTQVFFLVGRYTRTFDQTSDGMLRGRQNGDAGAERMEGEGRGVIDVYAEVQPRTRNHKSRDI